MEKEVYKSASYKDGDVRVNIHYDKIGSSYEQYINIVAAYRIIVPGDSGAIDDIIKSLRAIKAEMEKDYGGG